jgi:hypothetical protein
MFTWICPQCGREVPPAYNECPDCARKAAGAEAETPPPGMPQPEPVTHTAAVASPAPPAAPPAPAVYRPPAAHSGLPTWLLTILFAFAFLGLGAGIYWAVGYFRNSGTPTAAVESPAAKPGTAASPYQKYIEVSGVRFTQDGKKKLEVKYVIVNHSGADIPDLAGNVTIWGRTQKSEEDAAGTFTFATNLRPFESKEMVSALNTKHTAIELPDWQNISTDVQVTSPAAASPDSGGPR